MLFQMMADSKSILKASRDGNFEVVRNLTKRPHMEDWNGRVKAFMLAFENGHLEIVRYLASTFRFCDGQDALVGACHGGRLDIVRFLVVECCVNVNLRGHCGRTALMVACRCSDLDIVMYLVSEGRADVDIRDSDGEMAIHKNTKW